MVNIPKAEALTTVEAITDGEDIELDLYVLGNLSNATCYSCIHYGGDYKCPAYPKGIPTKYLTTEKNHTRVQPTQDKRIVFEPLRNSV